MSARPNHLAIFLRFLGLIDFAAVLAVLAPTSWLSKCHEWLGLGAYPDAPITGYLARSTSVWFVSFGVFLWFVSRDVVRHLSVIQFVAYAMIVQGFVMLGIDGLCGLPIWWVIAEGVSCIVLGIVTVGLCRNVKAE